MGTWGTGPFDNDAAADWGYGLANGGLHHILATLGNVADSGDFLDADEAAGAVAAAEAVARLRGGAWNESVYSEAVDQWVGQQTGDVPADLSAMAARAVRRVLAPGSDLLDLWEETGGSDADHWKRTLDDLVGRLDI